MTGLIYWGHLSAATASIFIGLFLLASGASIRFRLKMAQSENERAFNFNMVSLFLCAISLDVGLVAFSVSEAVHTAAVCLAALTGWVCVVALSARVLRRWN